MENQIDPWKYVSSNRGEESKLMCSSMTNIYIKLMVRYFREADFDVEQSPL